MKRSIALLLVLVLALSSVLASCGTKECETHVDANIDEICDVCEAVVPFTPTYLGFEGIYNTQYENDDAKKAAAAAALTLTLTDDCSFTVNGDFVIITNSAAKAGEAKKIYYNVAAGKQAKVLYMEKTSYTTADLEKPVAERPTLATQFRSIEIIYLGNSQLLVETVKDVSDDSFYYANPSNSDESKWTYEKILYTATGNEVAKVKVGNNKNARPFTGISDTLFVFDGKVYELKDNQATEKFDLGFKNIVYADVETEKYLYEFDYADDFTSEFMDMDSVGAVNIYDKTFNLVTSYRKPASADKMNAFVLSNGNVLIQLITELPEDATEYDYISTSYKFGVSQGYNQTMNIDIVTDAKFDVKTLVYDVETKAAAEVAFDYLVGEYYSEEMVLDVEPWTICSEATEKDFAETFVSGKLDNFAALVKIDGGKLDEANQIYVNLRSSDLKILGFLGQEIVDQEGVAYLVNTNRFVVYDKAGNEYLLNEKGEVIGNVTNAQTSTVDNALFFTKSGNTNKLYDMDLKLVVDMNSTGYKYDYNTDLYYKTVTVVNEDQSETKKKEYYACYAGEFVKLALPENATDLCYINDSDYGEYAFITYNYEEKVATEAGEITKEYVVICNAKGETVLKLEIIDTETTDNSVTTTVRNRIDDFYIDADGNMYITVLTATTTVKFNNSPTVDYKYELYIAK